MKCTMLITFKEVYFGEQRKEWHLRLKRDNVKRKYHYFFLIHSTFYITYILNDRVCTKSPVITRTCVYSSYLTSLFWGGFPEYCTLCSG